MNLTFENVVSALGLLGLGGVLGTYFRILWERRNTALLQKQEFKETRYKCIILLVYSALDFEKHQALLNQHGRNFQSRDELLDELKTEWHNMILFASDDVLTCTHAFISNPSQLAFRKSALVMRKDLWGGKLSPELEKMTFE